MARSTDNETWIIETGDLVIQKIASNGITSVSLWERLVYCLWVADYGMRNAGDLDTAADVHSDFRSEAQRIAKELSLPLTLQTFSLSKSDLEQEYFKRFESICDEIRSID